MGEVMENGVGRWEWEVGSRKMGVGSGNDKWIIENG